MRDLDRIKIIYSDNHLIAVAKPPNVIVQGDKTGDESLLEKTRLLVKRRYNKPGNVFLGLIHRLDRPVSGVVVFARTSKALSRMNKLFAERAVEKEYRAIVVNRPAEFSGTLVHHILKDNRRNRASATKKKVPGSKKAQLDYELMAEVSRYVLLKVKPLTGRPHQIRAQLASINCPIVGDLKYGANKPLENKSIGLHCQSLKFIHPVSKESIFIETPCPKYPPWSLF